MPHAEPDGERGQHDAGIFRIVDLRAVSDEPCRADNAEGAGEAGADDDHDQGADDREDDLRLHDRRRAFGRAAPAWTQRERRTQGSCEWKSHEGMKVDFDRAQRAPELLTGAQRKRIVFDGLRVTSGRRRLRRRRRTLGVHRRGTRW